MLIDDFLPKYDAREQHQIKMVAKPPAVFAAVQNMDFSRSYVIRMLFALRSLPGLFRRSVEAQARLGLNLEGLRKSGFVVLAKIPNQEIVLGLIGKFWTSTGCVQKIDAKQFSDFATPGFAKAVWNFSLAPISDTHTRLITETRVLCLDEKSRTRFRFYWLVVRPFSGWIRREALRCLKWQVEKR